MTQKAGQFFAAKEDNFPLCQVSFGKDTHVDRMERGVNMRKLYSASSFGKHVRFCRLYQRASQILWFLPSITDCPRGCWIGREVH